MEMKCDCNSVTMIVKYTSLLLVLNCSKAAGCQHSSSFSLQSVYRIKKGTNTETDSNLTVDEVVERIFQAVDSDGDGKHEVMLIFTVSANGGETGFLCTA